MLWPLANEKTRLHASVGRAFKLPSFFALANPLVGNPDLDPEVSIGADLGVDHVFTEKIETSFTLFFNRFDDLVDFDFGALSNVNESIDSYGVEASATWRPIEKIDVRANVTRQELDREDSDDPVRNRPEWYGGLRFQWWITERARWALDGQWVSERDDEQLPTGPGTAPGYQLYGTTFAYSIGEAWEIRGRVDNLGRQGVRVLDRLPRPRAQLLRRPAPRRLELPPQDRLGLGLVGIERQRADARAESGFQEPHLPLLARVGAADVVVARHPRTPFALAQQEARNRPGRSSRPPPARRSTPCNGAIGRCRRGRPSKRRRGRSPARSRARRASPRSTRHAVPPSASIARTSSGLVR